MKHLKRTISLLLCALLLLAMIPLTALTANAEDVITVYFKDKWEDADFSCPYVYYWPEDIGSEWPGVEMEWVDCDDWGDIYSATIPADVEGILFNDGYDEYQTVDIYDGIEDGAMWSLAEEYGNNEYNVCSWKWNSDYSAAVLSYTYDGSYAEVNAVVNSDTNPATCTHDGSATYHASAVYQGAIYEEFTTKRFPALGHDYIDHPAKDPSCTEVGWHAYQTCSRCDYSTYEEIPSLGHAYDSVVDPPTCTEDGCTTYTCSRCGDSFTSDIPALGHDWEEILNIPAGCTEEGYTLYICSRCDEEMEACPAALGHDFGEWLVTNQPTCTEKGTEKRVCSRCDYGETRDIDALGHDFGEWIVINQPTCTQKGLEKHICARCGFEETRDIDALGHAYDSVETPATCTDGGFTTHTCSRCHDAYITDEIPALGHDYDSVETPATCTTGGFTTHTCSRCGDTYISDEIDAYGHDYAVTVRAKATATRQGAIKYTCSRCGDTGNAVIPVLSEENYTLSDNTATCTEGGTATYTLKDTSHGVCVITGAASPALGHDLGEWFADVEPSCTTDGVEKCTCSRCDYFETRVAPALGHAYEPVDDGDGNYQSVCSRCGDIDETLTIFTQPVNWSGSYDDQVNIFVVAAGKNLTYQWYYWKPEKEKWVPAADTDSCYDSIVMAPKFEGRRVFCRIADKDGNTADSDIATISYGPLPVGPVITSQPSDWMGYDGDTVNISVAAEGEGLTYQWFYWKPEKEKWIATSDTDSCYDSIVMDPKFDGRRVYCKITDENGSFVDSAEATISYNPVPAGPVITSQPSDWTGPKGAVSNVTVIAQGEGLTYKWYYHPAGKTKWIETDDVDNVYDIPMSSARDGRVVYCKITDADNHTVDTLTATLHLG